MAFKNLLALLLVCVLFQLSLSAQSNYVLINNAIPYNGCHCYQLTADVGNEGGGVYLDHTINLSNSFDYKFSVFLGCNGSSGADGMTFILTNNITQIGAQGGGLGYSGLAGNSLAVEYDTYQNSWDPPYNHMALEYAGQVQHPTGTLVGPVPALASQANIDDCNWHTTEIVWNANTQTYTVYFDGAVRITYTGNIVANFFGGNPIVNWGWSGSTGGSENQQIFCVNSTSSWVAGTNYQTCNLTVPFSDISTTSAGTVQSWSWNFGDPSSGANNTSTLQNPTHTFSGTGVYTVTLIIDDVSGCADTFSHTVTVDAPIALAPTVTDPPCNGGNNGDISLATSGGFGASAGLGGYTYTWSNGQTASTDIGLTAGTYNVTVADGVCTTTASYTLSQPPALSATTSSTDASCGASNGSVSIVITGGTPPYQNVTWDGVAGYTRTGLPAGIYVANFTDANGCSALLSYTATVAALPCGYTVATSSTDVSCFGGTNGSVTLSVTGGSGTVTITWTNASGTLVGTGSTVSNLPAGTYTYHYTDGVPITFTGVVVVNQPGGALAVSLNTVSTTCSYLNNGSAVASVTANGTTPYSYAWSATGQTNSPTATNLSPGSIAVTVTDHNGCTGTASGTIAGHTALTSSVVTTPDSCFGTSTGSATVTAAGGTPGYTYQWNSGSTAIGSTIYFVPTGPYTVTVTDHNGCTSTASGSVSQPPLLTATITDSNVACFGSATGIASVTAAGGNGGYTYSWSPGSSTSSSISSLTPNTYYVTVTDSKLCKAIDSAVITQPATALTVTVDSVNVRCHSLSTGSITLIPSGGSLPYATVTWTDGGSGLTRTNLAAGTYCYTVKDAHLCTVTGCVNITQPVSVFTISVAQVNDSCFGLSDGSITLTPSGGTTPYAIPLWLDLAVGYTRNNLPANTYYYGDSDANGCLDTGRVIITQPAQLVVDTISTHQISCFGGNDGTITLGVSGGTHPYTYVWPQAAAITDSLGVNLASGTYTTYVTDAHGCRDSITDVISQPARLVPAVALLDSVSCSGGTNGGVTISATGGTSPYTFALDGSGTYQVSGVFTGLSSGTHTVTVKDAHGCDSTISFTIYQPTPVVPAITYSRNVSCAGSCDAAIRASATGGIPPYTFSKDGVTFSVVDSFTSLCAGSYVITVKDAFGCTQTINENITQPDSLKLTVSNTTQPSCYGGGNGQISVAVTGGTPGYLYSIDLGTPQFTGIFTGLSAGLHIIGVGDSHLCLDTIHVLLGQPAQLVADTISTQSISCFGGNNGAITIGVSGGTYPYTYVWPQAPAITDSLGILLTAGADTIYITDAHGCRDTVTATLTQPNRLAPFVVTLDSVSCYNGSNGAVTVNALGGTSPYTYALDTATTFGSSGVFTGLDSGTHTVTVKDAHGCDSTLSFFIYQPTLLIPAITYTRNASCSGSCNGAIALSATGGTAPYTYSKDGISYQAADSFTALCAGHDTLFVRDAKGCIQSIIDSITQPLPLTLAITDTIDPGCFNAADGHIAVVAAGGTQAYSYTLDGGTAQAVDSFTNAGGGSHTVAVTDAQGCTTSVSLTLGQPAEVTVAFTVVDDTCYGFSDGSILLTPTGGFGPYTYSWTQQPSNTTNQATSLAAGTYTAIVTDAHGCQETVTDSVGQPAQPVLAILPPDTTLRYGDTIQLSSDFGPASLGSPFSYLWTDTNSTLSCTTCPMPMMSSNDSLNTYTLVVHYNNNFCTASATTTIIVSQQDTFAVGDAFSPNGDGKNDTYFIQAKEVKSFHMDIFDRWGQAVFSTDDITKGWDGTFKGTPQPTGVYMVFFSLQYSTNKSVQRTSSLTLFR